MANSKPLPPVVSNEFDNSVAAARAADDPATNPAHLGNIPKGFHRDEEAARRRDELAEAAESDAQNAGSIGADALKPEREILRHLDPIDGNWPISNKVPGRYYVGVHKDNVTIAQYRARGYQMVQGDDSEALEFKGLDAAAGSSLRGLGDVLLMWVPEELRQRWEEQNIKKGIAVGAIELDEGPEVSWEDAANDPRGLARQMGAMAHARRRDPRMQQTVFRGSMGQIERLNEGIRAGNIPGFEQTIRGA